ncbi:tyrosine-type recombinase/integrase [Streptosporangium sp. NPDC087985]|uniref:tyrosine-type recombinase/integrase n=1 Tax=Streptosporangium sp. NPDC087985 TaxID=3366196 RepID=UPI0037F8DE2B
MVAFRRYPCRSRVAGANVKHSYGCVTVGASGRSDLCSGAAQCGGFVGYGGRAARDAGPYGGAALIGDCPCSPVTSRTRPWTTTRTRYGSTSSRGSGGTSSPRFILLAPVFGLRRGEALGLMWDGFDPEARTPRVTHAVKRLKNRTPDAERKTRLVISELKTRKSRRTLCLTPELVDALKRHRATHNTERPQAGEAWTEHGLIFPTAFGHPSDPDTFSHLFSRLAQKAGLGHWHPHELRHSGASLLLAHGTPLHVVSDILGHASIAITKDVYSHLLAGEQASVQLFADTAYDTGEARCSLHQAGHRLVIKPAPLRPAIPGGFTLDDFAIDTTADTVTCPAAYTVALSPASGQHHQRKAFFGDRCVCCPLHKRCTTAKTGRILTIRPHHDLMAAARRRAVTDAVWRADYRRWRPPVERDVAWIVARGNRRLRYIGAIKNDAWLHTRAAALNLRRLISLGLTRTNGTWVIVPSSAQRRGIPVPRRPSTRKIFSGLPRRRTRRGTGR